MSDNIVLNFHGFLSSAQSEKSQAMAAFVKRQHPDILYHSPQLPDNPPLAYAAIERLIRGHVAQNHRVGVIAHSLSGYFATHLALTYPFKAVLVSPLVHAYDIMCDYFGPRYNPHTNTSFEMTEADISFLISLDLGEVAEPARFLVMQQLGDEIVNAQEAIAFYARSPQIVEGGGNHDFDGFDKHFDKIIAFLFEE